MGLLKKTRFFHVFSQMRRENNGKTQEMFAPPAPMSSNPCRIGRRQRQALLPLAAWRSTDIVPGDALAVLHAPDAIALLPVVDNLRASRHHNAVTHIGAPTQLAAKIFDAGRELLARETGSTRFRLIGIGVSTLAPAQDADPADLVDQRGKRSAAAEHAVDRLREKFGQAAVVRGIALEEDNLK